MLAVFGYAFAHRKTHDFLLEIALAGHKDVTVFAAPFQKLAHRDPTRYWTSTVKTAPAHDTADICAQLGFHYVETCHDNVDLICATSAQRGLTTGIISGARILKRAVIDAFPDGIVNFHPGALPETSGLDAFFYTIKSGVDAGVTTHFIDPRVDAGEFLAFHAVEVGAGDTPEIVQANSYQVQIVALREFLAHRKKNALDSTKIVRPTKNSPMSPAEKWDVLGRFPEWRAARHMAQARDRILELSATGDTNSVITNLTVSPDLLEARSPEGWTPLIVAAFNQHLDTVEALLNAGADPNACGAKGTTVLMYAKTALQGCRGFDKSLLETLLDAGADPARTDMYGRDILFYVNDDPELYAFLKARKEP